MGIHFIKESLGNSETLLQAHWQAVALRLPLVQCENSGWWDAQPWLIRLCPTAFMLHTDASISREFWTMWQEKTLALAQVLQACPNESRVPAGILC